MNNTRRNFLSSYFEIRFSKEINRFIHSMLVSICGKFAKFGIFKRKELCEKFDLPRDLPVILLSAGSVGKMSAAEMIRLMETIRTPCQIVIMCGKHKVLRNNLDKIIKERTAEVPKFRALGFTTEMDEWMTVADLLIGKPGGLTLTESLAKNLPMVIWDPIPGQEIYNSVFLLENGAGVAPTSKSTLGFKVDKVLGNKSRLEQMQRSAGRLANPNSAVTIVSTVMEKLNEPAVKIAKMSYD